jgi:hypothetical protein
MIARALLLLALLTGGAFAQGPVLPGPGLPVAASAGFSLDFTGNVEDTVGGTNVTYSNVPIGAADVNRVVAVGIAYRVANDTTTITMTIGGISATQVSGARSNRADGGNFITDIYYASVPTGTTANVAVVFSSASARSSVAAYRIITTTPTPSAASFGIAAAGVASAVTGSITVPGGGAGFAMYGVRNGSPPVSWTNAVSDYSVNIAAGLATAGSGKFTATNAITGTSAGSGWVGAAVSGATWAP